MPSAATLLDARVKQLSTLAENSSIDSQHNGDQYLNTPVDPPVEQSSTLGNLLNMVLHSPSRQTPTSLTSSSLALGEGLLLIPRKILNKIQAGEYIDFSDLPPAKGRARLLPPHWEGHILVVQLKDLKGGKKLIPDFQTWTQCFAIIYTAALVMQYPDKFGPLNYGLHV